MHTLIIQLTNLLLCESRVLLEPLLGDTVQARTSKRARRIVYGGAKLIDCRVDIEDEARDEVRDLLKSDLPVKVVSADLWSYNGLMPGVARE